MVLAILTWLICTAQVFKSPYTKCVYMHLCMCHTITCLEDAGGGGGIAPHTH